ncbi:MAG: S-layer homology domain-containing protein [Chloroflexi bacterium]|nr:S-layer homology domain-containing protein [Chloroflexota bacterium]
MKYKTLMLIGTLIASLFMPLVFGVGNAHATTGCFLDTIGHPFETFICWMLDNGITSGTGGGNYSPNANVTRGQMAVFMQRQAEIPPSTGDIYVSAGFGNWHPFNSTDPLSYTYFSSQTQVTRSSAGSSFLSINPDIPTVLYGRSLSFKGVQFCFDTFASTSLNYVEINTYSHTTGSLGRNLRFSDPTTRTGNQCQLYTLASPITLTANDGVNFFIQVNWTVASTQFAIGRTTFIFAPTTTPAATPVAPQPLGTELEMPLLPMFDTSAP